MSRLSVASTYEYVSADKHQVRFAIKRIQFLKLDSINATSFSTVSLNAGIQRLVRLAHKNMRARLFSTGPVLQFLLNASLSLIVRNARMRCLRSARLT
jgi:hypothetical protein